MKGTPLAPSRLSAIIPTYNAAKYIEATLESLANQLRPADEIIVADDRSTDGTPELVERWGRRPASPPRVLRATVNSGGPAVPLNTAIAAAAGDLIAVIEHDDLPRPDAFLVKGEFLDENADIDLVVSKVEAIEDNGVPIPAFRAGQDAAYAAIPRSTRRPEMHVITSADATAALVRHTGFTITASNLLFRKRLWEAVGGFDPSFATTCDFQFVQSVCATRPLGFIDQFLVSWRTSAGSLSLQSARNGLHAEEVYRLAKRFDAARLDTDTRRILRDLVRTSALGAAYWRRKRGRFAAALAAYADSIAADPSREAILGILKLPPHAALHWARALIQAGDRTERR